MNQYMVARVQDIFCTGYTRKELVNSSDSRFTVSAPVTEPTIKFYGFGVQVVDAVSAEDAAKQLAARSTNTITDVLVSCIKSGTPAQVIRVETKTVVTAAAL